MHTTITSTSGCKPRPTELKQTIGSHDKSRCGYKSGIEVQYYYGHFRKVLASSPGFLPLCLLTLHVFSILPLTVRSHCALAQTIIARFKKTHNFEILDGYIIAMSAMSE